MASIKGALKCIINGSNNFCCLCFKNGDAVKFICSSDEADITRNCSKDSIVMSDLILTVLGSDFTHYVETMENICEQCAKSLIDIYTFIQLCNSNAMVLTNTLEGLNKGVQNIKKTEEGNSLLMSVNLDNFTSRILYDNIKICTPKMALNRFLVLSAPTKKENIKPKSISKKDSKILHESSNQYILKCKICLKVYTSLTNLRSHYVRVHSEKKYKCSKCPRIYCSQALLDAHEADSHCTVTCEECGKIFNNLHSLKMHQKGHTMPLVCPDCGRMYKSKSTFKTHVQFNVCKQERRHSPSEGKYVCDYCHKKYTQKMSLRVHIQFEHGNYKAHVCEWCGKKFWAQSRLKAHIVKHTRERNFICSICENKFVTKESLLYHTRLHTGEKPYKCPECSSRFLSASRRSDHIKRYHHGANPGLECDVCNGKFKSSDVLLKHKKTHEPTKVVSTPKPKLRTDETIIIGTSGPQIAIHEPKENIILNDSNPVEKIFGLNVKFVFN